MQKRDRLWSDPPVRTLCWLAPWFWGLLVGIVVVPGGCAGHRQQAPTPAAKPPDGHGPEYSLRLSQVLETAPTEGAEKALTAFFDVGYISARRDYRNAHFGFELQGRSLACSASLLALIGLPDIQARIELSRERAQQRFDHCKKFDSEMPENVRTAMTSKGAAYVENRLWAVREGVQYDKANSRPVKQFLLTAFEEGYRAGWDDRDQGRGGALSKSEEGKLLQEECSKTASYFSVQDLEAAICEASGNKVDAIRAERRKAQGEKAPVGSE